MILSMTGFGKASMIYQNKHYEVNIRSINSKQLELAIRTPSLFRELENEIRSFLAPVLLRGKVDYTLLVTSVADTQDDAVDAYFNEERLEGYYHAYSLFCQNHQYAKEDPALIRFLSLPGVVRPLTEVEEKISDKEAEIVRKLTKEALDSLNEFRLQEGNMLATIFENALRQIENYRLQVQDIAPTRIESIRTKFQELLAELPTNIEVDNGRLEQEMIYYIEKLDINEEITRLENHIHYFQRTLNDGAEGNSRGKKLGFIAQEMGREINTMGSKSNDHRMQHLVVNMKDFLEQIKEQVANVL